MDQGFLILVIVPLHDEACLVERVVCFGVFDSQDEAAAQDVGVIGNLVFNDDFPSTTTHQAFNLLLNRFVE